MEAIEAKIEARGGWPLQSLARVLDVAIPNDLARVAGLMR
jgi:hypothetical protein